MFCYSSIVSLGVRYVGVLLHKDTLTVQTLPLSGSDKCFATQRFPVVQVIMCFMTQTLPLFGSGVLLHKDSMWFR